MILNWNSSSYQQMSNTPTIPPALRSLLVQLEILSMVKNGSKINWGDHTFTEGNSWFDLNWWTGMMKRSRSGEGRKNTVTKINEIIDQTIDAIRQYEKHPEFFHLILTKLHGARNGLTNLIMTYQNRPETVAELRVCITNITLQLERYPNELSRDGITSRDPNREVRPPNRESTSSPPPERADVIPVKATVTRSSAKDGGRDANVSKRE